MDSTGPPVADLHVHTTASDGSMTVAELPAAARAAGLDCVGVTDHDRCHPRLDGPVTTAGGVRIVHGVELRVDAGELNVDLLGYGVRRTDALTAELDRLQRDRVERAERIVECVEDRLGVGLDLEPQAGVGRPHVARAIDDSDADCDYQGAFDRFIGADGPCYVPRDIPTFERGADLLSSACWFVGLAHPFRYPDVDAALALTEELDAVERHYPYGRPVDDGRLDRLVATENLLATGGSDAHDTRLGLAGLDAEAFERLCARTPIA